MGMLLMLSEEGALNNCWLMMQVKEHTSMLVDGDIMGEIGCKKAL